MKTIARMLVATLMLVVSSLTSMAIAQTPPKQPPSNWQKMKDCSAQTDKVAARYEWSEYKQIGNEIRLIRWQNHYSPKHERCFIQVFYLNLREDRSPDLPGAFSVLHDAFEYRELASCASDFPAWKESALCNIDDKIQKCGDCRKFIEDRMKY